MNFLARVTYIYILFVCAQPHITLGGQEIPARFATNWYNIQPAASLKDTATFPYILRTKCLLYTNVILCCCCCYYTASHTVAKPFILAPDRRIIYQASHSGRNRKRFSFNGQNLCQLHEDMQKIIKLYWRCCCYARDH